MTAQLNTIAVAVISFILGNVSGFLLSAFLTKKKVVWDNESRINFIIAAVVIMWVISLLVDIASPQYETSPLVHGIMGTIAGFFFWRPKTQ